MNDDGRLNADARGMVTTLRKLMRQREEELARMKRELRYWEERAGCRPEDGSDQPCLFQAAAQPKLW